MTDPGGAETNQPINTRPSAARDPGNAAADGENK